MEEQEDGGGSEVGPSGLADMDRKALEELASLKCITAGDILRVFHLVPGVFGVPMVNSAMVHLARCCKRWQPKAWQLEALYLSRDDPVSIDNLQSSFSSNTDAIFLALNNDGLSALIEFLTCGHFEFALQDLRICINEGDGGVTRDCMESFLALLGCKAGRSITLQVFNIVFAHSLGTSRAVEATDTFWKNFIKLSSENPFLNNLAVSYTDILSLLVEARYFEMFRRASEILIDAVTMGHLENLRALTLKGLGLGSEPIVGHFAKTLGAGHLGKLQLLDLSSNQFGDSVRFLVKALQSGLGRGLETLGLAENLFTGKAFANLLSALELGMCPKLLHLYLHGGDLGSSELEDVAEALNSGHFASLETVTLHRNKTLSGYWMDASKAPVVNNLLQTLENGTLPQLQQLQLCENPMVLQNADESVKKAIQGFYQRNPYATVNFVAAPFHHAVKNPIESLRRSNEERVERLKLLQGEEVLGRHGKLFFCGHPRAGKTSLRVAMTFKRLSEEIKTSKKEPQNTEALTSMRLSKETKASEKESWNSHWKNKLKRLICQGQTPYQEEQGPEEHGLEEQKPDLEDNGPEEHEPNLEDPRLEPTRGIEVTHLEQEEVTIALWDLAGQHEYEVLHSSFLPDSKFANGQATFFVIVCDAREDFGSAKNQLEYWMRFISSNSVKGLKEDRLRRVFVLLNCFHGQGISADNVSRWEMFLVHCKKCFEGYLNLSEEPFIADVKCKGDMELLRFKSVLLKEAKEVLASRKMPGICQTVQEAGIQWVQRQKRECVDRPFCPVLTWDEFRTIDVHVQHVQERKLEAAAKYLHEAGHIIVFGTVPPSTASGGQVPTLQVGALGRLRSLLTSQEETPATQSEGDLIVLDPEWFCKNVVGNLLLPASIVKHGEDRLEVVQERAGATFQKSMLSRTVFQVPDERREQVVMMLCGIGICYRLPGREDDMFVPAFIDREQIPGWSEAPWTGTIDKNAWVMGFSMTVRDPLSTLLPIAVLRRLQLDLGVDKTIGLRDDLEYVARKFSASFKYKGVFVLIEYAHEKQDRLDILVKQGMQQWSRGIQINVAQDFVARVEDIVRECAHGVSLHKQIVQPWSSADGWRPLVARNVKIRASDVIARIETEGNLDTMGWEVNGEYVREEDVLSTADLFKFYQNIRRREELTKEAVDYLTGPNSQTGELDITFSQPSTSNYSLPSEWPDVECPQLFQAFDDLVERKVVQPMRNGFSQVYQSQDKTLAEIVDIKAHIREVLDKQHTFDLQLQNLDRFVVGEKESSIPRFVYITENGSNKWWIKLNEHFVDTLVLRFLCEGTQETGAFHEVNVQEGVDLKKIKDWAQMLLPWVVWTLKVAYVATRIAGNAVLPGLGIVVGVDTHLSNVFTNLSSLTTGSAELTKSLFEKLDGVALQQSEIEKVGFRVGEKSSFAFRGSGADSIELKGDIKEIVRRILYNMKDEERIRKVGLRRVWLEDRDCSGKKHVVWICSDCYRKHEHLRPGGIHDLPIGQ